MVVCFDTWIILNNLPCDKHIVDFIENGKGVISLSVFDGYTQEKQIPQYLLFRGGVTHLIYSLEKLGKTFISQREILKTAMNHDEINAHNWRDKNDKGG